MYGTCVPGTFSHPAYLVCALGQLALRGGVFLVVVVVVCVCGGGGCSYGVVVVGKCIGVS